MFATGGERGPEILQPGAAPDVHRASACVLETIAANHDVARAALALHAAAIQRLRNFVANRVAFDEAPVAPDHIDGRAAPGAPTLDDTVNDAKIPEAGELDAVVIAIAADVADAQAAQHDPARRRVRSDTAVVDVQPVVREFREHQIMQFNVSGIRKMDSGV